VVLWGAEDAATALQYVWMLRGDPRVREELALEVLQHCVRVRVRARVGG